jgi:hypothetical protein
MGAWRLISTHHVAGGTEDFFVDVRRRYEHFDPHAIPGLRLPASADISTGADELDSSKRYRDSQVDEHRHARQRYSGSLHGPPDGGSGAHAARTT